MDSEVIVNTLGGTVAFVAATAWLSRSLISQFINKDLERFKANLKSESNKEIERLRNELKIDAEKQALQYASLHAKRAEIMAELYERLYDMQGHLQMLKFEYEHREIREDIDRKYHRGRREEWVLEPGIDTLSPEEEEKIILLQDTTNTLFNFYKKYRLYFTAEICTEIDKSLSLASYLQSNYRNIALKDVDGNLLVNAKVKKMWDKAYEIIPNVLQYIESKFREILGV